MYLRRKNIKSGWSFVLSESYRDGSVLKHRSLIDMGPDPGIFVEYPGGNSFHVRESLIEKLQAMGELSHSRITTHEAHALKLKGALYMLSISHLKTVWRFPARF